MIYKKIGKESKSVIVKGYRDIFTLAHFSVPIACLVPDYDKVLGGNDLLATASLGVVGIQARNKEYCANWEAVPGLGVEWYPRLRRI